MVFVDDADMAMARAHFEVLADVVAGTARHHGIRQDYVRIEVTDAGGPWRDGPHGDDRPHGFDVVDAIAGPGNWGSDADTVIGYITAHS